MRKEDVERMELEGHWFEWIRFEMNNDMGEGGFRLWNIVVAGAVMPLRWMDED